MPGLRAGPSWRVGSPSCGSILTTSAPQSPSWFAAAGANAHDGWDRDRDRWEHQHYRHSHWRESDRPRTVVVERRPVVVERPIIVAPARPAPVYMAPMMPAYAPPPMDPSVNFN